MAEKRKRNQNFTVEEKHRLLKLITSYKNVILKKKADGTKNSAKNQAWINICEQFKLKGNYRTYRSKYALMKIWEKMKRDAKAYKALSESFTRTVEGTVIRDPFLEQVCDLMATECGGIAEVDYDPDFLETTETANCNKSDSSDDVYELQPTFNKNPNKSVLNDIAHICKRRSILKDQEEKLMSRLNGGFTNANKKIEIQGLKKTLLVEEIKFKRQLYQIKLGAAKKDLEIKNEVLNQIKEGGVNVQDFLQVQFREQK